MSRALRILVAAAVLLGGAASSSAAETAQLVRGTAITDPDLLRKLDDGDVLTIARLLAPERKADGPLTTDRLFAALPQLKEIPPAIDAELERYIARQKAAWPTETIGTGEGFDVQLFDRANLTSPDTRFVLAGIVNRMDRAYVAEESCGEIRLIYRLTRFDGGKPATRLPMTFNLVLKARDARQREGNGKPVSCAEIARRWLDNGNWQELIGGRDDAMLDRIETNIQVSVAPKSALHDFRSDYLLKVFKYDAATKTFAEAVLENQIDRDRILADDALRLDFKHWLLAPGNLREFDRGTVLIPERFLAKAAVVPTPAGLDASALQPEFGMVQGEEKGEGGDPVFTDDDVVGALKQAAARGDMQNIRSVAGFQRRLNDVTCSGCHQTRGIGGFHFPGVDWLADKPSNAAIVPASPHFVGDQLRRRDILTAFTAGKRPDFSRGFASRPQTRGSRELAGSEYQDGWGAHCSLADAGSGTPDKSFTSWNCANGLSCQAAAASRRIGMCFIKTR
jgi:mono/diheme cytochrome c family protein